MNKWRTCKEKGEEKEIEKKKEGETRRSKLTRNDKIKGKREK